MNKLLKVLGPGPFSETEQGNIQRVVFVSTFALIAKLVASDGDMSKKELVLIDQLMRQTMKLDDQKRKFASKVFNESRRVEVSLDELVNSYRIALKDRPKMYEWLLDSLVRVSLADEVVVTEEQHILERTCSLLGFDEHKLREIQARYVAKSSSDNGAAKKNIEAYQVLEVSPESSMEEVQKGYDLKMAKYNTEKLILDGFAGELVELAMKRQAEFTSAFMQIRKERGH